MGRRRKKGLDIDGVLLVDKPKGLTSFSLTERVRRALNANKAGHTGTLDPMATGLMVVCLGQGTKLVQMLTGQSKAYEATVKLGEQTNTYDAEGEITARAEDAQVEAISTTDIEEALKAFRGTIDQRPPAFSAIKVDGQRLHALARAGEAVEAPVRTVTVHTLEMRGHTGDSFNLFIECSKGTYIRSIAHDVGQALGVGAHLTALRRTLVGPWSVVDAMPLETLQEVGLEGVKMLSLTDATVELPTVQLQGRALDDVAHGRPTQVSGVAEGRARGLDGDGRLRALLDVEASGRAKVVRGFTLPVVAPATVAETPREP
ncbi:MAG: tRNA pseudouridine(55) synthase TruB [Bradymonadia bacterium]